MSLPTGVAAVLKSAIFGVTTLVGGLAAAHSGIPRVVAVHLEPGDPAHVVAVSDAFGIFHKSVRSDAWTLTCAESYGGDSFGTLHTPLTVLSTGELLVANAFSGLHLGTPDACDWEPIVAFSGTGVADVQSATDGTVYALALPTTDAGALVGEVWRSSGGSSEWAPAGTISSILLPASLVVAPSDPQRLYVAVRRAVPPGAGIYRSFDGGTTWAVVSELDPGEGVLRVRAVHPTAPDVLYVQLDRLPAVLGDPEPEDEILVSSDGGQSWTTVHRGSGDLPGLSISPDGTEVVVGGPSDGLWRARSADIVDGGVFSHIYERSIWALAWTPDGLYGGHDDFGAADAGPRFTLGVSTDRGESFEPVLVACEVELNSCPQEGSADGVCRDAFSRVGGFEANVLENVRCTGLVAPRTEPSAPGARPVRNAGCLCRLGLAGLRRPQQRAFAALLVAVCLLLRRRRGVPPKPGAIANSARAAVRRSLTRERNGQRHCVQTPST